MIYLNRIFNLTKQIDKFLLFFDNIWHRIHIIQFSKVQNVIVIIFKNLYNFGIFEKILICHKFLTKLSLYKICLDRLQLGYYSKGLCLIFIYIFYP